MANGNVLVPFDNIAVKGPKKDEHNLEPLNAGTKFTTETLINYMLAAKAYIDGNGKNAETVKRLLETQNAILATFIKAESVPMNFDLFIDETSNKITLIPSNEEASKITKAKLLHLLGDGNAPKFLVSQLIKSEGSLVPEDLLFLSSVPRLAKYFEQELKSVIDLKDAKVSHNAADILGRRLLGDDNSKIEESLKNLKTHWDKESVWLKSDNIENIEKGLIYRHDPNHFILYLLATNDDKDFRFKRTLNFFTYLLENEWGVAWDNAGSFITLPSSEYQVFQEEPREKPEPGDLINFRVRIDNTCPNGFGTAFDLSSLIIKSGFTPNLIYTGTQRVDGLEVVNDFLWRYNGFPEGTLLEYIYQAFVPSEFTFGFVDGRITVTGRRGFSGFGLEDATGDDCDDIDHIQRLNILPFENLQGIVYEDRNVNGIKDAGELGIANILVKDTRGRLFRSDADGIFTVLAGTEHEGVQLELKSLPPHYILLSNPTMLVNRNYTGKIHFGLVPSKTVKGFVYVDSNGNGQHDPDETAPAGVVLKAKDKEVVTGKGGQFIFRNLPVLWQQWIEIKKEQPFYNETIDNLKIVK
jgi:hypothetical protein